MPSTNLSVTCPGSQLELSQTFAFDNSTTVTMATISVTLNGVTADSVTVTITQPGLDISYDETNIPVGGTIQILNF